MDENQILRERHVSSLVPRRALRLVFLTGVALVACTSDLTAPSAIPNVRPYLTAHALQFIGFDGTFLLSAPVLDTHYPTIDSVRAGELATAFLRLAESNPGIWTSIETQHNGTLQVADMKPVARVEFMESPYEPVADTVREYIRRAEGPYYVFRYLEKGAPAVTVTVSVYDTHVTLVDGHVVFPPEYGEEFYVDGMRPDGYERPIGPEEAVQAAARQTGAKIDALPTLLRTGFQYANQSAKWKIILDRAVSVQGIGTGTRYSTNTLYVGMSLVQGNALKKDAFFVALLEQPAEELDFRLSPPLTLKVRKGFPVAFNEVVVLK